MADPVSNAANGITKAGGTIFNAARNIAPLFAMAATICVATALGGDYIPTLVEGGGKVAAAIGGIFKGGAATTAAASTMDLAV